MKSSVRVVSIFSLVTFWGALGASACSDDDVALGTVAGDAAPNVDSGPRTGESDATDRDSDSPDDRGVDAGLDADVEASTRTCSLDGFCHTTLPSSQTLRGVWGDGLGIVWAVSEQGNVLRWDGTSWSIAHTVQGGLFAIWGSGPTDIWVGGDGGLFHGTGATSSSIAWAAVPIPGDPVASIRSVWGTGANDVWAVGRKPPANGPRVGRVLHFAGPDPEGVLSWSLDPISSRPIGFIRVWGSSTSDVWLGADKGIRLAEQGVVFQRASGPSGGDPDAGTPWNEITLPTDPALGSQGSPLAIFTSGGATTADDAWVFGRNAQAYSTAWRSARGDAGALEWSVQTSRTSDKFVWAIWGTSRNDAWSAGEYGHIRHWNGNAWTQARITMTEFPFTKTFYAAWGDGKGELWFVGDNAALNRPASAKP